jgi:dTDP-3-amino-2,3,6-trideoxy-4-keto-D-glucose/dTDP-3-amino-3,4,6-trideoxy-alpha-D-glucose/dTDP-2,6-dideoxy-D-kanosamine transaminase
LPATEALESAVAVGHRSEVSMKVPTNDLRRGYREQRNDLEKALLEVAASGWYVHGRRHEAFEASFADFIGVRYCLGVGNGTDALELAVRAVDVDDRRRVVVTAANAGGYSTAAVLAAGMTPRYADVDDATACISAATVLEVLDDEVRAVVVTHLYGRLTGVDALVALCRERGVALIEDCAQAAGAHRDGRRAGSYGDLGAFSFYPTKNLGALGDGGAVVTDDSPLAERVRRLRQYGWSQKYVVSTPGGINSRLDELQAAILNVRLPKLDEWNERRRRIVERYAAAAEGGPLELLEVSGPDHAAHLAVGRTRHRDEVRRRLGSWGVATEVHYPVPDHLQTACRVERLRKLPVTEALAEEVVSLPCFPQLTDLEIDLVCEAIRSL